MAGARRPVAKAMAGVYTSLWIAGGLTLLVALGSGALAFTTSGSLIRQLRRLQSHAEAIGRGEFEHVVDRARVRELAELATAFNRMGTAVHEAQEALEAANAALEQRVRERTAELAATIVRLERTERELRTASLYARGLLEASLDPLVTISPEGKITDVNEATEGATGVPRQQLVGSDFSDYFTEPDRAREGYRKVLSEGLVRDYPLTIRHASGRTIDVLYNAVVYRNEAGAVQGVFAAARDVTEQKTGRRTTPPIPRAPGGTGGPADDGTGGRQSAIDRGNRRAEAGRGSGGKAGLVPQAQPHIPSPRLIWRGGFSTSTPPPNACSPTFNSANLPIRGWRIGSR